MWPRRKNDPQPSADEAAGEGPARAGFFGRLKSALSRTGGALVRGVTGLFTGRREVDEALLEDLETVLLSADVGIAATDRVLDRLRDRLGGQGEVDAEAVLAELREALGDILRPVDVPFSIPAERDGPFVILVVGVNGTGKTTTIGKLAHRLKAEGHAVMLAAGDTFRAAAVEQLQTWGERNGVPVVAQHTGADSASVVYDAVESARARGVDVLIADTAGRLHTQAGLMDELRKVRRVIGKLDACAPHETLLVLDAGTGQNALSQAREFGAAVDVSGLVFTKLDGTAKGGIVFAIAEEMSIPVRFVGVGEGLEDLRPFDASAFLDALLAR